MARHLALGCKGVGSQGEVSSPCFITNFDRGVFMAYVLEWRFLPVTFDLRIFYFIRCKLLSSMFPLMYDYEELVCAMKCCGFLSLIIVIFVYNELVCAMIVEFAIQAPNLEVEHVHYIYTIKS